MIAGLESVTSGDIEIAGKRVNDVHPKDRNIAMVFQNYALYAHMKVKDNMSFSLQLAKRPQSEIDEKVKWAARILNLEPYLERYPRELSGGQRQRVAMGRAIVQESRRLPLRRAPVQPRRQAPRPDAHRDQGAARPPQDHHRLRHP